MQRVARRRAAILPTSPSWRVPRSPGVPRTKSAPRRPRSRHPSRPRRPPSPAPARDRPTSSLPRYVGERSTAPYSMPGRLMSDGILMCAGHLVARRQRWLWLAENLPIGDRRRARASCRRLRRKLRPSHLGIARPSRHSVAFLASGDSDSRRAASAPRPPPAERWESSAASCGCRPSCHRPASSPCRRAALRICVERHAQFFRRRHRDLRPRSLSRFHLAGKHRDLAVLADVNPRRQAPAAARPEIRRPARPRRCASAGPTTTLTTSPAPSNCTNSRRSSAKLKLHRLQAARRNRSPAARCSSAQIWFDSSDAHGVPPAARSTARMIRV